MHRDFSVLISELLAALVFSVRIAGVKLILTYLWVLLVCPLLYGQLIEVHGHSLFLDCDGDENGATVILIAGGHGTTEIWNKIQKPISRFARVCSYDRLGLGRSEPLPKKQEQSLNAIVSDLAGLLESAKLRPPYVLVGHSIGGLYARAYDEHHDAQVAGMVLIDSSHEEQIWRFAQSEPDALSEYPRWRDKDFMRSEGFLAPGERLTWTFTKPLIVLEHGIPPEPVWHEMQMDLARRSRRGHLLTATESSHYIQKIQPALVIDAIHKVLEQSGRH